MGWSELACTQTESTSGNKIPEVTPLGVQNKELGANSQMAFTGG